MATYRGAMADTPSPGTGRLIVLEGIDGSGKTTVARRLADALREAGHPVLETQEPTDSYVGTAVREALADPNHDPVSEALLFAADHAGHVARLHRALEDGAVVVSDRYSTSWLVYQSITLEPAFDEAADPRAWLEGIVDPFELAPDLVLVLDLPVEVALDRVDGRHRASEKFEQGTFLKRVRGRYLELAQERGWETVDANRPVEQTVEACLARVDALIEEDLA